MADVQFLSVVYSVLIFHCTHLPHLSEFYPEAHAWLPVCDCTVGPLRHVRRQFGFCVHPLLTRARDAPSVPYGQRRRQQQRGNRSSIRTKRARLCPPHCQRPGFDVVLLGSTGGWCWVCRPGQVPFPGSARRLRVGGAARTGGRRRSGLPHRQPWDGLLR